MSESISRDSLKKITQIESFLGNMVRGRMTDTAELSWLCSSIVLSQNGTLPLIHGKDIRHKSRTKQSKLFLVHALILPVLHDAGLSMDQRHHARLSSAPKVDRSCLQ